MQKRLTLLLAAALLGVIGLAPVLVMVAKSFLVDGALGLNAYREIWASDGRQFLLMGHSILLSLYVTSLAAGVGVPLGVLFGKTDLPFRRAFMAIFAAPLLIPPYVIAVAWVAVVGSNGWIDRLLTPEAARQLSSALFGLHGCALVLTTAYMPVVMLLTVAYLGAVNPRLEEAGRLVSRWPGVLRAITLPLIGPALLFAAILVFLLTLGEIGVPSYLRFPVYPVETMTQFAAFYDFSAATAAAVPLLLITLAVLALERGALSRKITELRTVAFGGTGPQIPLGRWRPPLFALVFIFMLITVALPLAVLIDQSASLSAYAEALLRAGGSIGRSVLFAAIGASLLTVLGFFWGYLIYHRMPRLWRSVDALTLFLFVLPGSVVGIGLISLWNTPLTNFIYGAPAIIILGYLAQYAVLPTRMTAAAMERIPLSFERAAQLAGADWFMTLRRITLPLAGRGLAAAWAVGYVFCLRDLSISMVVYPPGSETLPVRIMTLMANGAPSLIAALCVILIAATLLPFGAVAMWLSSFGPRLRA